MRALLLRKPRDFKQKRAAVTYEALLDGAQIVFARRGFEGAQTPEIAKEAGVSTGAFYRYFADKREAFVEMVARNLERVYEDVAMKLDPSLFRGPDVRAAMDRVIDVLFDHIHRDAQLERVYLALSLSDPDVQQLRVEFESRGLEALTALVQAIVPPESVVNARAAALVIQVAAVEVAAERAGLRPRLDPTIPDADIKATLREMIHRYLFPKRR